MSESKAYELDFSEEPPKAERKGIQPKAEYKETIDAFVNSGKPFGKIEKPKDVKLTTVRAGLDSAIKRMGKSNEVKIIVRKKTLYLISKDYADKRKWVWKVERKKK